MAASLKLVTRVYRQESPALAPERDARSRPTVEGALVSDPVQPRPLIYRAFRISPLGKIEGPPIVIEASDDDNALRHASTLVNGHAVELWDCSRFIAALPPRPEAEIHDNG